MYTYFRPCGLWLPYLMAAAFAQCKHGYERLSFCPFGKSLPGPPVPGCLSVWLRFWMAAIKFALLSWRRERLQLSWRSHTAIMQIETVPSSSRYFSLSLSLSVSLDLILLYYPACSSLPLLLLFLCKYVNIFDDFLSCKMVSLYYHLFIVTRAQTCD